MGGAALTGLPSAMSNLKSFSVMKLCYNDICAIISGLTLLAENKENTSKIVGDEKVRGYALRDKENALRLKELFKGLVDNLFDIPLDETVTIEARWGE